MKKGILALIMVLLSVFSVQMSGYAQEADNPGLVLDGSALQAYALVEGGSLCLPLRAICEALGYEVEWSGSDRTISAAKQGTNIGINLNNSKITVNGHGYYMEGDVSGKIPGGITSVNGSTYLKDDFFTEVLGLEVGWDKQNNKVALNSAGRNAISIKNEIETYEDKNISLTLQYPQIEGLADKTAQDGMNGVFKNLAEAARSKGMKNAADYEKFIASYGITAAKCETFFDYRLKYNRNGFISVVFLDYQYSGGAHGSTIQSSYNYKLDTGKEYKLKDLFKDGADYVSAINSAVMKGIDEKVKLGILPENPLTPFTSIKEDQGYYLSGNSLYIYFQQYEYYPYAAGIQEFPVELSTLKDILRPDLGI